MSSRIMAGAPRTCAIHRGPSASFILFLFAMLLTLLSGCASRTSSYTTTLPRSQGEYFGYASWYGNPYHGRLTASGETYNMEALTAAHRTLPFNSIVRVERQDNRRSVQVRINDRGPFVAGRVIDLSRAAARQLGMLQHGVALVRITPIQVPQDPGTRWAVMVGGFDTASSANRLADRMSRDGHHVRVIPGWHGNPNHYHIQLKDFRTERSAFQTASWLRQEGLEAFVVRSR